MSNKMLIDATHPEETRVVVLRGNRVEEFDFESASRKQLRGNIYLAKVTRVEPSLQAAFVDYGGNRHGFLAFSEIHPDYYQIPVADRQALLDDEKRAHRDEDENGGEQRRGGGRRGGRNRSRGAGRNRSREVVKSDVVASQDGDTPQPSPDEFNESTSQFPIENQFAGEHDVRGHETADEAAAMGGDAADAAGETDLQPAADVVVAQAESRAEPEAAAEPASASVDVVEAIAEAEPQDLAAHPDDASDRGNAAQADDDTRHDDAQHEDATHPDENRAGDNGVESARDESARGEPDDEDSDDDEEEEEIVESVGGDAIEEVMERAPRHRRHYKIQEVIKRRQVMLVQVVKEERGTKGAALTTYLSLAGRYSVLMPNTARGGGISRKVTNAEDRRSMKEIADELEVPEGMGVILRTAGASRTKLEVKRDFEYLLRLWETVRDLTLKSSAPTLVYEEGSLVKRAIRDLYHKDIEEIVVEGEGAYREAKDFMRMLMPSAVKNVMSYSDAQPIFTRYGIESQLDAMFQPTVQLKSGGYVVINQTEALVAIDVNSGRATREHSIEETATKTNSEAAAEIARQLRLRDLAGLIVIDFIDMDEGRNNRAVERKMKEALKSDRARIQVGRISHFGLLEMSRQRIRSSVLESSTEVCPHCGGTGHVRSVSSVALQLVRAVEETLLKGATHNLIVRSRSEVAIYVLNHKRAHLRMLEERFKISIAVNVDPTLTGAPSFAIDRGEQIMSIDQAKAIAATIRPDTIPAYEGESPEDMGDDVLDEIEAESEDVASGEASETAEASEDGRERGRRKRRRGRRGRARDGEPREQVDSPDLAAAEPGDEDTAEADDAESDEVEGDAGASAANGDGDKRRRRRGRRGGRRNRKGREDEGGDVTASDAEHASEGDAIAARQEFNGPSDSAPSDSGRDESFRDEPQPIVVSKTAEPKAAQAPAVQAPTESVLVESAPARTVEPSPAEPVAEKAVRRRSTIREAPPSSIDDPSYTPPSPPVSAPLEQTPVEAAQPAAEEVSDKPRRRGWWSMRG
jgi:ribonuclease E